jgi:hypothetical protein
MLRLTICLNTRTDRLILFLAYRGRLISGFILYDIESDDIYAF